MILIAFGTRPEWIKIKPLLKIIDGKIPFKLFYTGQHLDIIDKSVFEYDIEQLNLKNNIFNRLDSIVAQILHYLDSTDIFHGINYVLVQGDTTSAFAVALAAFHRKIKIIHLEAGLRSWDKDNPFPEEFNRISIGSMANIHLCPTDQSKENLRYIASNNSKQYVVGNTVLDNLYNIKPTLENIILVTMHRRENLPIIDKWFDAINNLAKKNQNLNFIFPMHPNLQIQKHKNIFTNVKVVDPLSYGECIDILSKCSLIITDSGGLQEESSFLKKKCIVCRKTTERQEGKDIFSYLCADPSMLEKIFNKITLNFVDEPCPYGDGKSCEKILHILESII